MPKNEEKKWEDDIKDLVLTLGFKDSITSENTGKFQVDASGGDQETYFEFDATVTRDPIQKYTLTDEVLTRRRKIEQSVNNYFPNTYKRYIWVVWIKGAVTPEMRARAKGSNTVLLNEEVYKSFRRKTKNLQGLAAKDHEISVQRMLLRYRFLNILGAKLPDINAKEIASVPATKFHYGRGKYAYIFAMKPDTLVKTSFALIREEVGNAGYQRLLDEGRAKAIAAFIERSRYSFPNNIILNFEDSDIVEKKCLPTKEEGIFDCVIELPNTYCSAQVIDGQHRLFSFENVKDRKLKEGLKLDVLAFSRLSKTESAQIFIDLNKEQKKLDPSLYWEIVGDYLKESPDGAISLMLKSLTQKRSGVFKNRILFPSLPGKDAKIKLANICKGIKDRHLLFGVYERSFSSAEVKKYDWNFFVRAKQDPKNALSLAASQINLFFSTHEKHKFNRAWQAFVMTNTGINIMLRVLVETLKYNKVLSKSKGLEKHYTKVFNAMNTYVKKLSGKDIDERIKTSSEGARGTWADEIIAAIHKKIPLFARDYFWQKSIDEHSRVIHGLKNRTGSKMEAYEALIKIYIKMNEGKKARSIAKRLVKDFDSLRTRRILERLSK